jgi:hypothetical protein
MNPLAFLQQVNQMIQDNGGKVPEQLLNAIQPQTNLQPINIERKIINQLIKKALWQK